MNAPNPSLQIPAPDHSGICYLCWKPCDPTKHREHVPPKGCFPKGSTDLIQVSCCYECNHANSRDDEYFRTVMAMVPVQTPTSAAVWSRALERTVARGRLKKEIDSIRKSIKPLLVNGNTFGKFAVQARKIRLQLIRITKGFLRHYHPEVDYRDFEWQIGMIDQSKIVTAAGGVSGLLRYHERGNGAHRCFFGVVEDQPSYGLWMHIFHDGHAFYVRHRPRERSNRKHSGVQFD